MRVLVVSQNPVVRLRAMSGLLARADVEVIEAASAREAHTVAGRGDLDVLVMDGDLDPEGGFSVLYELRAAAELDGRRSPPAVVMVGREQDRWLAVWAGANVVLRKPVDPFAVAREVAALYGVAPAAAAATDESGAEVRAAADGELAPET